MGTEETVFCGLLMLQLAPAMCESEWVDLKCLLAGRLTDGLPLQSMVWASGCRTSPCKPHFEPSSMRKFLKDSVWGTFKWFYSILIEMWQPTQSASKVQVHSFMVRQSKYIIREEPHQWCQWSHLGGDLLLTSCLASQSSRHYCHACAIDQILLSFFLSKMWLGLCAQLDKENKIASLQKPQGSGLANRPVVDWRWDDATDQTFCF